MARHEGAVAHFEKIAGAEAANECVWVSGSNIGVAGTHFVAVSGFFNLDPANAIEALGEGRRETLGHVLYRDNSRAIRGHLFKNLEQSFRASRGGPDSDNFFPLLRRLRTDSDRNHNIRGMILRRILAEPAEFANTGRGCRPHGIFQ